MSSLGKEPQFAPRRRVRKRPQATPPPVLPKAVNKLNVASDSDDDETNSQVAHITSRTKARHISYAAKSAPLQRTKKEPDDETIRPDYSAEGLRRLRAAHSTPTTNDVKSAQPAPKFQAKDKTETIVKGSASKSLSNQTSMKRKLNPKADPFSAAWQGYGNGKKEDSDAEEDPTVAIITNAPDESMPGTDMGDLHESGSDSEGSGKEWTEFQMARGAGQHTKYERKANPGKEISREDIEALRSGEELGFTSSISRCMRRLNGELDEYENKKSFADQELKRLNMAKETAESRIKTAKAEEEKCIKRAKFYDELSQLVSEVCSIVSENSEKLLAVREKVLKKCDGVDEFGRNIKEGIINLEEEDGEDLPDVRRSLLNGHEIMDIFYEWKKQYPEDYESSKGDDSCGRLLGTLGMRYSGLQWLTELPLLFVSGAAYASDAGIVTEALIESNWIDAIRNSKHHLLEKQIEYGIMGGDKERAFRKCEQQIDKLVSTDIPLERMMEAVISMNQILSKDLGLEKVLRQGTVLVGRQQIEDRDRLVETLQRLLELNMARDESGIKTLARELKKLILSSE